MEMEGQPDQSFHKAGLPPLLLIFLFILLIFGSLFGAIGGKQEWTIISLLPRRQHLQNKNQKDEKVFLNYLSSNGRWY